MRRLGVGVRLDALRPRERPQHPLHAVQLAPHVAHLAPQVTQIVLYVAELDLDRVESLCDRPVSGSADRVGERVDVREDRTLLTRRGVLLLSGLLQVLTVLRQGAAGAEGLRLQVAQPLVRRRLGHALVAS